MFQNTVNNLDTILVFVNVISIFIRKSIFFNTQSLIYLVGEATFIFCCIFTGFVRGIPYSI